MARRANKYLECTLNTVMSIIFFTKAIVLLGCSKMIMNIFNGNASSA